jgi:hypothetical protein
MGKRLLAGLGMLCCLAGSLMACPARAGDVRAAALRKQVLAWLDANHVDDAENKAQVRKMIAASLDEGGDCVTTFGPAVMKSGKAYQVHVFAGKFHRYQLTEARAKRLLSGPKGITFAGGKRNYRVEEPRLLIKEARIDGARAHDPRKKVIGEVEYELKGELPANVAVRLTYRVGKTSSQLFHHLAKLPAQKKGKLRLSFAPLQGEKDTDAKVSGPLVVFLDICTVAQLKQDPYIEVKVYSNSKPVLIDVGAPAAAPGPTASLAGTRWQFSGTDSTIELLEDGKFLWNGENAKGWWKQDGKSVTVNVNDFTLFELILEGDRLNGTWKRLKGEDAGIKRPSSARRIK